MVHCCEFLEGFRKPFWANLSTMSIINHAWHIRIFSPTGPMNHTLLYRAHHKLTHGLIQIWPAGIWFPKNQNPDPYRYVPTGDPSQQVRYPYIAGHLQLTGTCRYYLQINRIQFAYFEQIVQVIYIYSSPLLISPSSELTTVTSLSVSFPPFKRWHLSLKTWIISPSGISPGILLHACRTVEVHVDWSDSTCQSLLTVSPPQENPRSTSHEEAMQQG